MSIRLSAELERAMEARGYDYNFEVQSERLKVSDISGSDILLIIFNNYCRVMLWKSLIPKKYHTLIKKRQEGC